MFQLLEHSGLTFGRWVKQAGYSARCGVMAGLPQSIQITQLAAVDQYAAVELFRRTMLRHSVIAYRNNWRQIDFSGDGCLGYVPIRVPDTICVQEWLPAGAAAVLINPAHTYKDLFLPIDATEKYLFDAIDGSRSIGDLAATPALSAKARRFFEQLWFYDQVVFEASRGKSSV